MPKKTQQPGLEYEVKSGWEILKGKEKQVDGFCRGYMDFISVAKTERLAVNYVRELLKDRKDLYLIENRGRAIAICRKGDRPLSEGVRLVVSHLDVPRLDLKARPLYEDTDLVMLKTHYYGGIKKYQWLARPLALHGVVARGDGSLVEISLGEDVTEPCFTIEDLLPHLSRKAQGSKKVSEAFQGEKLNLICGSRPDLKEKEKKVKARILGLLNKKYGLSEEDFVSADIEVVPAGPAREIGFDASMVGGYGQDDRVCSYCALQAVADAVKVPYTCVALLVGDRFENPFE